MASSGARPPFYYGWLNLLIAALAMVGTLPGRTQGLGLITVPLLNDLKLDPDKFANMNFWATLIGACFSLGIGTLQDRIGSRVVLSVVTAALGLVTLMMSSVVSLPLLFLFITLTRGLGQTALSAISLTMVGQWFRKRIDFAMAVYAIIMTIGFMGAFPGVQYAVEKYGWRVGWAWVGWSLLLVLTPIAFFLTRDTPEKLGQPMDGGQSAGAGAEETAETGGYTLFQAVRTPAFWVIGLSSALYGLIASGIGLFNQDILAQRGLDTSAFRNMLAVMALTGLLGNFLGGLWARTGAMNRLMSAAMFLMVIALVWLANVSSVGQLTVLAVIFGLAGGFVTVIFFSFWRKFYGRAQLGRIQGLAQSLTVLASAFGPVLVAQFATPPNGYARLFYILAGFLALLGMASWYVRLPALSPAVRDSH